MKDLIVGLFVILSLTIGSLVVSNAYVSYTCSSYQKVTGVETTFVQFDACYIKGDNGRFERYDDTLRNNN